MLSIHIEGLQDHMMLWETSQLLQNNGLMKTNQTTIEAQQLIFPKLFSTDQLLKLSMVLQISHSRQVILIQTSE